MVWWDHSRGRGAMLVRVTTFKFPQSHSRVEAWHAKRLEVDLWLADGPHSELIFTSHQWGMQCRFATEDLFFSSCCGLPWRQKYLNVKKNLLWNENGLSLKENQLGSHLSCSQPLHPCALHHPALLACLEVLILMIYEVSARRSCALPQGTIKRQMYDSVIHKYPRKLSVKLVLIINVFFSKVG